MVPSTMVSPALGITIVVLIAILLSQGQSIMARMDAQIRFTSGME